MKERLSRDVTGLGVRADAVGQDGDEHLRPQTVLFEMARAKRPRVHDHPRDSQPLPGVGVDYQEQFAAMLDALSPHRHVGTEPGDPALAAQAVLTLVENPAPPVRLLLGNDAFDLLTTAHRRRLDDATAQESSARAADG